jgi:predicted N-acetyltransferase YhbS
MVKSNYMEFALTPETADEIIFAMEDQSGPFMYDSAECRCVPSAECVPVKNPLYDEDDERYYAIPLWDSISGFRMMERFSAQLRNPFVREDLRAALANGQGVFRNFKNILKNHPEAEKLWFQYKEREMRHIVREWYNSLRDFWGLERIGAEPEETDEIVEQDFTFRPAVRGDAESIDCLLFDADSELASTVKIDLLDAMRDLWARIRGNDPAKECILVAESAEGEIVGCSISSPIPSESLLSVQLSLIVVFPEFRGLGIGKELLARTVKYWAGKGFRWLLYTSPVVPAEFFPVLQRAGFTEKGHLSVLELI